jgi:hypothetical protein
MFIKALGLMVTLSFWQYWPLREWSLTQWLISDIKSVYTLLMADSNHWEGIYTPSMANIGHQGGDHPLNGQYWPSREYGVYTLPMAGSHHWEGIGCVLCISFAHLDFAVWGSGEWDFTTKSSYFSILRCGMTFGFGCYACTAVETSGNLEPQVTSAMDMLLRVCR